MAEAVTTRLPEDILREIEALAKIDQADRSTEVRRLLEIGLLERKKRLAIEKYEKGESTLPEVAKELKISIWQAIELFKKEKVEAQYDAEDFKRDLEEMGI
jgi:predicted HTH domain antitoxin